MRAAHALAPWAGWIGAVAGWFVSSQFGASFTQLDCAGAAPLTMGLIGICGALMAVGGALISIGFLRKDHQSNALRMIAVTSTMAAAVFFLAIVLQTTSSFIIPRCFG